jgi:hypothetical protein
MAMTLGGVAAQRDSIGRSVDSAGACGQRPFPTGIRAGYLDELAGALEEPLEDDPEEEPEDEPEDEPPDELDEPVPDEPFPDEPFPDEPDDPDDPDEPDEPDELDVPLDELDPSLDFDDDSDEPPSEPLALATEVLASARESLR